MDTRFNGTTVETNGVRSIAGGGTGASTAEQARINLGITGGGVTSYNDLTDLPTLGTAAATAASDYATAAQGTDSRTPTAHKSSHATGGDDALSPADIGAAASSHTHPLSQLEQSSATDGQVPVWDATTSAWVPQSRSTQIDRRIITSSTTWVKPVGAKQVVIECVAGGGGGGYGAKGNAGAALYGGAGGGAGGYSRVLIDASELTDASYTVTIGSGGSGGIAPSTNAGLGTFTRFIGASQGQLAGANPGGTVAGNGGTGSPNPPVAGSGGSPATNSGGLPNITGTGGVGTGSNFAPTSGGAGGGLTLAATVGNLGTPANVFNGGSGGNNALVSLISLGGAARSNADGGSATSTTARTVSSLVINGCGGGGGGASSFGAGGNGANGTGYGSGGGGGGSTIGSGNGGNGGNGAPGVMVITTYF